MRFAVVQDTGGRGRCQGLWCKGVHEQVVKVFVPPIPGPSPTRGEGRKTAGLLPFPPRSVGEGVGEWGAIPAPKCSALTGCSWTRCKGRRVITSNVRTALPHPLASLRSAFPPLRYGEGEVRRVSAERG
jgi:hypothetical protein